MISARPGGEVDREMRCVSDQPTRSIKDGAGKVEPLLDVRAHAGFLCAIAGIE